LLYHCPFTTSGSVRSCPLCYSTIEALMKSILRPFTNYLRWLENYLFMLSCKQKIHKASLFHSQRFLFPINFIKHSCFLRMFVVMIGYYSHTTKQFSVFICVVHTYHGLNCSTWLANLELIYVHILLNICMIKTRFLINCRKNVC